MNLVSEELMLYLQKVRDDQSVGEESSANKSQRSPEKAALTSPPSLLLIFGSFIILLDCDFVVQVVLVSGSWPGCKLPRVRMGSYMPPVLTQHLGQDCAHNNPPVGIDSQVWSSAHLSGCRKVPGTWPYPIHSL